LLLVPVGTKETATMCFERYDDDTDDLGRETERVDEVDGRGVEGRDDDWLPLSEIVSGLLRGWRGDD